MGSSTVATRDMPFDAHKHKSTFQDGRDEEVVCRMHEVSFTALSDADIYKNSVAIIDRPDLYSRGDPAHNGPLDTRMGVNLRTLQCAICSGSCNGCGGHFGHTETVQPLFNYGYFHFVKSILNILCLVCYRIPLNEREKKAVVQRIIRHQLRNELDLQRRKLLLGSLAKKIAKVKVCPYCGASVGPVRTEGMYFFIVEQPFPNAVDPDKPVRTKMYWDANRVRNILQWISHEDQILLLMDPRGCRPDSLISQVLPISPVTIRPSVSHGAQMSFTEDDISIFFAQVVGMDKYIRRHLSTMVPNSFIDYWEQLQYRWYKLVNANVKPPKGLDLHGPGSKTVRASKGFEQRLKGKMGRFRGNLSGKRVNYSSRTVISPDPNLRIDQVGVPAFVAKKLTFPERVTSMNLAVMKQMVLNGPDIYPGAHSVSTQHGRMKKLYIAKIRPGVSESLRIGDTVHRHVLDGDIVLFNRQPSLHKLSIMAHRVKVLNNRTFRFNECVCAPYNADFDGDEMNLHLLQTYQAKAEAESLMATTQNLATPKNGEILIAATQDFITGSYLISQKDRFYTRDEFYMFLGQVLSQKRATNTTQLLPIGSLGVEALSTLLPPPAIWKPVPLWSGKQLMSVVLAPEFDAKRAKVNLFNKGRNYTHKGEDMCPADGFLTMRRGQILSGTLDKSLIGSGKTNIFFRLMMDFGAEYAADAMFNLARTSIYHVMTRGFSIGITDVQPATTLTQRKESLVESGYMRCDEFIRAFTEGNLPCEPGLTPEDTLEAKILKELSLIRETAGKMCLCELSRNNAPLIMALSGSKGSTINISQMVACVGQQAINGKRVGNGFDNRTLPLFKDFSRDPKSKGFVANSFFTGLEPYEFIFHTMAGREGLVDTAVKTAETGYMYRRLMKALEDLVCKYDNTVRNAAHDILQLKFGDDGLDPREMEGDGEPIDFKHYLYDMNCIMPNDSVTTSSPAIVDGELPTRKRKGKLGGHGSSSAADARSQKMNAASAMLTVLDRASALGTREVNKLAQLLDTASSAETAKLTLPKWQHLCAASNTKCVRSRVEPGTAAGALSAQSIGEPGTQMTLKTFHFAGVATMNITLGVPRIKEIINAVRHISTPIITTRLSIPSSEIAARIVKARLERTTLSEITRAMAETYERQNFYLELTPNASRIHLLRLECSIESLARAIDSNDAIKKLGVKCEVSQRGDKLLLSPPDVDSAPATKSAVTKKARAHYDQVSHRIKQIREVVGDVIVAGIPSIKHAIIHMDEKNDAEGNQQFVIFAEGAGLRAVLGVNGVDLRKTTSNSCLEVADVLGIEAARQSIIYEINYTMQSHGMTVDARHLQLLADLMCHQGVVLGITRHGMAKMRSSSFKLASFEVTLPSIYDAAFFGTDDSMTGVTESIIAGQACNFGSGLPQLIARKQPNKLLADRVAERFSTTVTDNIQFRASGAHLPSIEQLKNSLLFSAPTTTTSSADIVEHALRRKNASRRQISRRRASIQDSESDSDAGSDAETDDADENDEQADSGKHKKVSLFKQARNLAQQAAAAVAETTQNELNGSISKRRQLAEIDEEDADGNVSGRLDGVTEAGDLSSRGGRHNMDEELSSLLPATSAVPNGNGVNGQAPISTGKKRILAPTNGVSNHADPAASTDDDVSTTNTASTATGTSSGSQKQKKRVRFADESDRATTTPAAVARRTTLDKRKSPAVMTIAVVNAAPPTVKVPVTRRGKAQKPVVQLLPIVAETVVEAVQKPRRGRPRKVAS